MNIPERISHDEPEQPQRSFMRREWLQFVLLLLPFSIIPFVWNDLPDQMPIHWNMAGEVDGYGSRLFGTFGVPVFNMFIIGFLFILPFIDPRRENYKQFESTLRVVRLATTCLMLVVFAMIIAAGLGYELATERIIITSVIMLFLVLGNMIGRVRSNYFVGIRTPWTLENQLVWRKTHRMAATLWVAASLLALPIPFFFEGTVLFSLFVTYTLLITVVPIVYSFILFKRLDSPDQHGSSGVGQAS